jgi:SlyX protein
MDDQDPVLRRLDALELKACDADDLLDQLNLTVYRQQQQIELLQQQLALLRQQLPEAGQAGGRQLLDDLPPHY